MVPITSLLKNTGGLKVFQRGYITFSHLTDTQDSETDGIQQWRYLIGRTHGKNELLELTLRTWRARFQGATSCRRGSQNAKWLRISRSRITHVAPLPPYQRGTCSCYISRTSIESQSSWKNYRRRNERQKSNHAEQRKYIS